MTDSMEPRLLKVFLIRLAIFAIPFVVYFVWREIARRSGRAMGSTPWAWLVGAGALLAALSLMSSVAFPRGPNTGVYVPAEAGANGAVTPGHFVGAAKGAASKANP